MATDTEPWYVGHQRAAKASRIAESLRALRATADDVAHFTDEDRRMAEASVSVRRGSQATWRLVTEMLAGSSNPDALCPTCGRGDPEGVVGPRQRFGHEGLCSR